MCSNLTSFAAQRLELLAQKVKWMRLLWRSESSRCHTRPRIDRRHDEVLNNATNRSKAVVLGVHVLRQFLLDLRERFYLDVVGVCGNEGRAKQELAWSDLGATDSYDSLVYWCLQQTLTGDRGLRFNELQANECLFTIHDTTFLRFRASDPHDRPESSSVPYRQALPRGFRHTSLLGTSTPLPSLISPPETAPSVVPTPTQTLL